MKRQTLQISGALLATTALSTLSTMSMAGNFENANNGANAATAFTPISLSAQVFGGTAPQNITLGPTGFNIDFTNQLTTSFNVDIEPAGAKFSTGTTPTLLAFEESTNTSLAVASLASSACTLQVLTERILISNCVSVDATTSSRIDHIQLSGVIFNQANGLATAGNSISLSGIVTGSAGNQTFELLTGGNFITSANTLQISSSAGSFTLSNTVTPPFSTIGASTTNARLVAVTTSLAPSVGTNLSTVLSVASSVVGSMEFAVTHGVLTDAATTKLEFSASNNTNVSITPSAFVSNTASFDLNVATFETYAIDVTFNGTTAIQAWPAGTVTVTTSAGNAVVTAPAGLTDAALASFVRGGFSAQINTAQSSAVSGFDSFVRITNNGAVAGTATIQVLNDMTGSVYGSFTTSTIVPNATIQVSMPTIEAGIPIATPAGQYMLNLSGSISGYAQHVMLNTATGSFVDLSGFRIGDATTGFP